MMRSTWAARAGFRAAGATPFERRYRSTDRPAPVVERIEDVRFAELDPRSRRRGPRASSRAQQRSMPWNATLRGTPATAPAGYELECRTNDANQVTVIPLAQVPLHLPGVLCGIVHAC